MLHCKIELHTDSTMEEAAECLRSAISHAGNGFHGKEENGEFRFDYKEKGLNAFRPEIRMKILPEEDGCLLWTDMKLHPVMLGFLIFWTVAALVISIFNNVNIAPLFAIPLFWGIALISFRIGVKSTKQALMTLLEAYEITG